MPIIICDIDGTLANISHRLHHIKHPSRNWAAFNAALPHDEPVWPIIKLIQSLHYSRPVNYTILLVSGRGEESRNDTTTWLYNHNVPYEKLYMRPAGDYRKDTIIKREILSHIRTDFPNEEISFVVDDRQSVVDMWRNEGLICLQAAAWKENESIIEIANKGTLTLMIGPSGAGKSTWLEGCNAYSRDIRPEQIISSDSLRAQLCGGDFQDQSRHPQVFAALYALAKARIQNGLDAVIDATNIKRADRLALIHSTMGNPIPNNARIRYIVIDRPLAEKYATAGWRAPDKLGFDLIAKHHSTFTSQLKDILKGDGLPNVEVIDLRTQATKEAK